MSRATIAFDRVVTFLAGLVLLAAGLVAVLWWSDHLGTVPRKVDLGSFASVTGQPWWPWALGAAGVVLTLLGIRWLAAHLPDRGVRQVELEGSGAGGRLVVDPTAVVSAAAEELARTPGVQSVRGLMQRDRGQLVARFNTSVDRGADLRLVGQAADTVTADLKRVLERDDVVASVRLRVARTDQPPPRVG